MKQHLLTPAPTYHGEIGRLNTGRWYRADYISATGRLGWRRVPWWRLLERITLRAHFGNNIATALKPVRGMHTTAAGVTR